MSVFILECPMMRLSVIPSGPIRNFASWIGSKCWETCVLSRLHGLSFVHLLARVYVLMCRFDMQQMLVIHTRWAESRWHHRPSHQTKAPRVGSGIFVPRLTCICLFIWPKEPDLDNVQPYYATYTVMYPKPKCKCATKMKQCKDS